MLPKTCISRRWVSLSLNKLRFNEKLQQRNVLIRQVGVDVKLYNSQSPESETHIWREQRHTQTFEQLDPSKVVLAC
jgi:hypothetical protein